ncbi:hypothetical protein JKF63_04771 [Porcisia hertigi]|uniref:Uncharacterized protein n=1 Tax=Porcisia hertigi TaxID=2761500 RepID=A0A836IRP0_9TRYP|nr:hypothetical protein JKF63_04771 [Porcisia hertigi]
MSNVRGHHSALVGVRNEQEYSTVEALRKMVLLDGRYAWVNLPFSTPSQAQLLARQRGATAGPSALGDRDLVALLESDSIPQYVWPAADSMCEWVASHGNMFEGKCVLELGCGAGVLGLMVAQYARRVVLTDCSPVSLALVLESVARNGYDNCEVAVLQWGREEHLAQIKLECGVESFDIVMGSDVFYFSNTLKAGLATARSALTPQRGSDAMFICGSVARSDRMDHDLEEIPLQGGFFLADSLVQDPFRLYIWKVCSVQ